MSIFDVISTILQKRKMHAMITMKLFARPRFSRTNTPRRSNSVGNKVPYFRRKDDSEDLVTRTHRSSSFCKIKEKSEIPNHEEVKQIFDKVRDIATFSFSKTPIKESKYSARSGNQGTDEYTRRKNSFLHKLSEL